MPVTAPWTVVIIVHLGGVRVIGDQAQGRPSHYLPSIALFLAPGSPSQWLLDGPVDVAGFYLPAALGALPPLPRELSRGRGRCKPEIDPKPSSFASLKYRIFDIPRFLAPRSLESGTEKSLATLMWNLKRTMAAVGSAALAGRLVLARD